MQPRPRAPATAAGAGRLPGSAEGNRAPGGRADGLVPDPQVACACGRLRRAARALTQLYDDALAPIGLRVTQFSLLRTLAQHGPLRISDLAARQLLDRTALSRNLDPLIARGLVCATPGRDARTREVALTPAGARELHAAAPAWRAAQAQVRARVGDHRLDALIELLGELEALHPKTDSAHSANPVPARAAARPRIDDKGKQ
jgi:DNA-binding MarR family transcriptional regulator